jgi:hypothetical protein
MYETPITRKRGRPPKVVVPEDNQPNHTADWTEKQIESLLKHCLQTHGTNFLDTKKKEDVTLGWKTVKLDFNLEIGVNNSVAQLKLKFFALKKILATHAAAFQSTGTRKMPKTPNYWEVLHIYFGDHQGLSGLSLGSSEDLFNNPIDDEIANEHEEISPQNDCGSNHHKDANDYADGLSDSSSKRARLWGGPDRPVALKSDSPSLPESRSFSPSRSASYTQARLKNTSKGKVDVGASLASLGSSFEKGIMALATSLKPRSATDPIAVTALLKKQGEAIKLGQRQQEELEGLNSSLGVLTDKMDSFADRIGDSVARALMGILEKD